MTRLPDGVARPGLRRLALSQHGDLVVILTERTVTVKPKRARVNGIIVVTWGQIYERAVLAEIHARRSAKNRRRR